MRFEVIIETPLGPWERIRFDPGLIIRCGVQETGWMRRRVVGDKPFCYREIGEEKINGEMM
jgi:hypothetical protein